MASSVPSEPESSTLKRRARRRLVGSIALVLIAVIVLPMIFDEEKKPLDQDVLVQIPSQDAVTVRPSDGKGRSFEPKEPRTLPPDAPARAEGTVATPAPPPGPAAPADSAKQVPAAKAGARSDTEPAPGAEARKVAKAEAVMEPRSAPKAEGKAVPTAEEARVKAILDDAMAKETAAKETARKESTAGFAVQIGAFAGEDKIREAREKLGGAGFKSYTEKLDTKDGERTRVRAGPFASREAAEAARDKIRALGFSGAAVVAK